MSTSIPLSAATTFESRFCVRSYELDSFGHVNHAVYLNYFEQARFDALTTGGFDVETLARNGWAVHVVRVEVDFKREALLGQEILVRTRVSHVRNTSMTLEQVALDPATSAPRDDAGDPNAATRAGSAFAEGKVVIVWIGPDRSPMRIPPVVRTALGVPDET
jgi:YbgC/YbaW family acyl-CoA thioester hydrolase